MAKQLSIKRLQIDKSNATTVIFLAVSAFVLVFSLVASRALLNQRSYQSRVIAQKKKALKQLKDNNVAAAQLVNSYKAFVSTPENLISGSASGTGDRDGDNARIVLDALPSKYDFPALAASLEKLLTDKSYQVDGITGSDDELNQSAQTNAATGPIEIPFQLNITDNIDDVQGFLDILQRSIRPIKLNSVTLSASGSEISVSVSAKTYYQPEKVIQYKTEVVK